MCSHLFYPVVLFAQGFSLFAQFLLLSVCPPERRKFFEMSSFVETKGMDILKSSPIEFVEYPLKHVFGCELECFFEELIQFFLDFFFFCCCFFASEHILTK